MARLRERLLCALLLLLAIAVAASGAAGQANKPEAKKNVSALVAAARESEVIRVSIVSLASPRAPGGIPSFADLNLGDLAYGKKSAIPGVNVKWTWNVLEISTRFGLLLREGESRKFQTATVRAFVSEVDPDVAYAIDGIKLTTIPQTISAAAPIGVLQVHHLEITIPTRKAPGPVANDVGFLVTPN